MKVSRPILFLAAAMGVLVGGGLLYDYLATSHAERNARRFCDGIEPNTNISIALKRASGEQISYIFEEWYSFYFPAAFFDMVICEVKTDSQGLVESKSVWISRD